MKYIALRDSYDERLWRKGEVREADSLPNEHFEPMTSILTADENEEMRAELMGQLNKLLSEDVISGDEMAERLAGGQGPAVLERIRPQVKAQAAIESARRQSQIEEIRRKLRELGLAVGMKRASA